MISIGNVTVAFGSFTLLDGIDFHISENDRIGLVGKNGAGKTTLMKLICGLQAPTSGHIEKPSGIRIGYLPQVMEHHRGRSVMEEVMTAFEHLSEMEREIGRIAEALSERTDYESAEYMALITRMNDLSDTLSMHRTVQPEVACAQTLLGLGFKESDFPRKTETFSQGWNMRIELAKVLLSEPDVLLLDEPTNHLDIESIEWLEDYLKGRKGALLLVSHDRKFLDTVTNRTVEIMLGHIHDYKVPYSQYVGLRKERLAQQQAAFDNQQRMIEKTEDFINRFRYKPTKSNQVQSRIKALEKLERVEVDETDQATLTVKFPPAPRSGDVVFKASGLTAGYPGKTVFTGADIEVRRGEKVALIGRNGEGKTTLMRIITGQLAPLGGEVFNGYNVQTGYYAQDQENILDGSLTVWETLDRAAVGEVRTKLRDILAQFLFRGEDIDKRVSVLSGGERARLGMAGFMLRPYNLLALDEPTNHMDIKSKDILKQALQAYDGTLIVVSHDRDFLDGLVEKMYEFRDGKVREHLGSVQDFLQKRRMETLHELERSAASSVPSGAAKDTEKSGRQEAFARRRSESKEIARLKKRIETLEVEIGDIEQKMKQIESVLSSPGEGDDIMELTRTYLECKRDADHKTSQWEKMSEELENLNN